MNEAAAVIDTKGLTNKRSLFASAWLQLIIGIVCMVMIANLQYGWTFFVPDIQKQFGWDRASIQIAFTLFVLFETWLVPVEGWFVDHYGPQIVVFFGGLACGLGWALNSYATSLRCVLHCANHRRDRSRCGLRYLHRQFSQVVSETQRTRSRFDRCRIRSRICVNCHSYSGND